MIVIPTWVLAAGTGEAQQIPTTDPAAAVDHYMDYTRVRSLYDAGQFADAEPMLLDLLRTTPDDGILWHMLARARHQQGDARGAIAAYRRSMELGSRSGTWAAYQTARLHASLNEADSALIWLGRALDRRWDDRPAIIDDTAFAGLRSDARFRQLAGNAAPAELVREEAWARDIDYLVAESRRMHAGPDRPAHSAAFDSAAAALRARVAELDNDRIVLEMSALITMLGDGHSGIYGAGPDSPFRFEGGSLPLRLYQFADGLFVVEATPEHRRWIGAEVVSFGDVPAREAIAKLQHYMHHDNLMTVRWLGVHYQLPTLPFLHAIGATHDSQRATLTLRPAGGTPQDVTFEGGPHVMSFPRRMQPAADAGVTPLYLSRLDENYWLHRIPDRNIVYFQFNQVRDASAGPTIAQFADTLRHVLEASSAQNLIIDVRHNNGGNNSLVRPLLRTLVWWELDRPENRIFVITGRNTFSAAQNFINRVERMTDAVFVGEASGSRPNFTGEETNLLLPHSRVRGSISTMYWQDSDPNDTRMFIAPDVPVGLYAADYFAGRDPALEAVLMLVSRAPAHPQELPDTVGGD